MLSVLSLSSSNEGQTGSAFLVLGPTRLYNVATCWVDARGTLIYVPSAKLCKTALLHVAKKHAIFVFYVHKMSIVPVVTLANLWHTHVVVDLLRSEGCIY